MRRGGVGKEIVVIAQPRAATKHETKTALEALPPEVVAPYHIAWFVENDIPPPPTFGTMPQPVARAIADVLGDYPDARGVQGVHVRVIRGAPDAGDVHITVQFDRPMLTETPDGTDTLMISNNTNTTIVAMRVTWGERSLLVDVETKHLIIAYQWIQRLLALAKTPSTSRTARTSSTSSTSPPTPTAPPALTKIAAFMARVMDIKFGAFRTQMLVEIGIDNWPLYQALRLKQDKIAAAIAQRAAAARTIITTDASARELSLASRAKLAGIAAIARRTGMSPTDPTLETLYKTYEAAATAAAVATGRCAHVQLIHRRAYKELAAMMKPRPQESQPVGSIATCSACNMPAMCPHHYYLMERDPGASTAAIHEQLQSKFAGHGKASMGAYYCKICGEKLFRIISEKTMSTDNPTMPTVNEADDELYYEVRNTINSAVKFDVLVDASQLTSVIVDAIKPAVSEEHAKATKDKTATHTAVAAITALHAAIYTHAYLVKIMVANRDISFKGTRVAGNSDVKRLQELLRAALISITTNKAALIQSIPRMTTDAVRELFKRAYKSVTPSAIKTESYSIDLPPEYVANSISYAYAWHGLCLGAGPQTRPPYSDAPSVIGMSIDDLPTFRGSILQKAPISKPWGKGFEYQYAAYVAYVEFVRGERSSPAITERDTTTHPLRIPYVIGGTNRADFAPVPVALGRIYCMSGERHKWSIWVWGSRGSAANGTKGAAPFEVTTKNAATIPRKEWLTTTLLDKRCERCGELQSVAMEVPDATLEAIVDERARIEAFYALYRFRCPAGGGIHAWKDDTCTKCGLLIAQIQTRDAAYYKQYADAFVRDTAITIPAQTTPARDTTAATTAAAAPQPPYWTHTTEPPYQQISAVSGVPLNVINNLGAIPGALYSKIEEGNVNPAATCDPRLRAARIHSHITYVAIMLETERNGTAPSENPAAITWAKDILAGYQRAHENARATLAPADLATWCLNVLFGTVLAMEAAGYADMARRIAALVVNVEYMQSNPGALRGRAGNAIAKIEDDAAASDSWDVGGITDPYGDGGGSGTDPFSHEESGIDTKHLYHGRD
jgi:hypothetical protein